MNHLSAKHKKLLNSAINARQFAYAPYSKYKVGAAVLTTDGKIFSGCNVENASFGLSNCAERVAIVKAVSEGRKKFLAMAVVTDSKNPASPCGSCRQVIREFGKKIVVIMASSDKRRIVVKEISDLLPNSFDSLQLKKSSEE